ncbi:uncharacterized protein LOC135379058 isoform X3 [Ornithodoros turicata]|uniref:uncharacterized protein LOC135379058 isoform X3 n=1 Tax=Ornithodoros turicata TaxID=34597 RepID=UPI0031387A2E
MLSQQSSMGSTSTVYSKPGNGAPDRGSPGQKPSTRHASSTQTPKRETTNAIPTPTTSSASLTLSPPTAIPAALSTSGLSIPTTLKPTYSTETPSILPATTAVTNPVITNVPNTTSSSTPTTSSSTSTTTTSTSTTSTTTSTTSTTTSTTSTTTSTTSTTTSTTSTTTSTTSTTTSTTSTTTSTTSTTTSTTSTTTSTTSTTTSTTSTTTSTTSTTTSSTSTTTSSTSTTTSSTSTTTSSTSTTTSTSSTTTSTTSTTTSTSSTTTSTTSSSTSSTSTTTSSTTTSTSTTSTSTSTSSTSTSTTSSPIGTASTPASPHTAERLLVCVTSDVNGMPDNLCDVLLLECRDRFPFKRRQSEVEKFATASAVTFRGTKCGIDMPILVPSKSLQDLQTTNGRDNLAWFGRNNLPHFAQLNIKLFTSNNDAQIDDIISFFKGLRDQQTQMQTRGLHIIGVIPAVYDAADTINDEMRSQLLRYARELSPDALLVRTSQREEIVGVPSCRLNAPSLWTHLANVIGQPSFVQSLELIKTVQLPSDLPILLSFTCARYMITYRGLHAKIRT